MGPSARGTLNAEDDKESAAGGGPCTLRALTRESLEEGLAVTLALPERFVSIGTRLGGMMVLVVGVASVCTFAWSTVRERDAILEAKQKAAYMVADLFALSLGAPLDFGDEDAIAVELAHLRMNPEVSAAVVWQLGRRHPIGTSGAPQQPGRAAPAGPSTHRTADILEVVRPVLGGDGKVVGTTLIEFSLARENAAYSESRLTILVLCLGLALGTSAVLIAAMRRQVVAPLDLLLGAARRLERGERGVSMGVKSQDELGRLARAFEAMGAAIADRELRLAEAHHSLRELFDHMRQGILVFDREGRVAGTQSRAARVIFGRDTLDGCSVEELLYPEAGAWDAELQAFREWRALGFETQAEVWGALAALAPKQVTLPAAGGAERVLALEFRPISRGTSVDRMMLLATDETEKARLAHQVVTQNERHARQMAAMARLVSGGGQQFVGFLDGARSRLDRADEVLRDGVTISLADLTECFGHVHTLRGEARVFGLDELAARFEAIEGILGDLRAKALGSPENRIVVASGVEAVLRAARDHILEAEQAFVTASPIGRAVLEQITVRRPDLEALCQLARARGGPLADLAERLAARSFGEIAAPLVERAGRWAEAAQRRVRIELEGRDVLIPLRLAERLGGVLTHLVKNSIAHGVESQEHREEHGKAAIATVRISALAGSGSTLAGTIQVEDDGAGFASNPILLAASANKRPLGPESAVAGSFRVEPPTSDAELAGRGMGLQAVVRDLTAAGYELFVEARPGGGSRFLLCARASARPTSEWRAS